MLFIPPESPFLNTNEEFFSAWRWKVCDRQPQDQMFLFAAMDAASDDTSTKIHCHGNKTFKHVLITTAHTMTKKSFISYRTKYKVGHVKVSFDEIHCSYFLPFNLWSSVKNKPLINLST